jgi:hypothetical protein
MAFKTIDEKGRLTLGKEYAGKHVVVEKDETTIRLTVHRLVPEREAWLWANPEAIGLVEKGLDQVRRGELNDGPDLESAFRFADSIPDDE